MTPTNQNEPEELGKFDVGAFNAEMARIALVAGSWLAGLVEARSAARKYLSTLTKQEQQIVYDADSLAMRIITRNIHGMLDSKPICGDPSKEQTTSEVI
jgi:hypothetical protein